MNKENIKSLKLLNEYFKETNKDIIKKEINLISDLHIQSFALTLTDVVKSDSEQLRSSCDWCNGNKRHKGDGIASITEIG